MARVLDRVRPDPAREARAVADEILADLRAPHTPAPAAARPEPDVAVTEVPEADVSVAPHTPVPPDRQSEEPSALADLADLIAAKVEERMAAVLAATERRGTRARWRFLLLGIAVGFLAGWAGACLWG